MYKDLPFDRGQTAQSGAETIDANVLANLEGQEYTVEDVDPATGIVRSGIPVTLRVVRNTSGGALLPKRLGRFSTAQAYGTAVDGYVNATAGVGYPIDEYLPATGVANNDLFYVVIKGPAIFLTDLAGGASNVFNVGDRVVGLTAATSGATTAGRVAPQDLTGATAPLANQIQNRLGFAMSAKTTGNTNADLLVNVGKW